MDHSRESGETESCRGVSYTPIATQHVNAIHEFRASLEEVLSSFGLFVPGRIFVGTTFGTVREAVGSEPTVLAARAGRDASQIAHTLSDLASLNSTADLICPHQRMRCLSHRTRITTGCERTFRFLLLGLLWRVAVGRLTSSQSTLGPMNDRLVFQLRTVERVMKNRTTRIFIELAEHRPEPALATDKLSSRATPRV